MNPNLSEWAALAQVERLQQEAAHQRLLRQAYRPQPRLSWLCALRLIFRPRPAQLKT